MAARMTFFSCNNLNLRFDKLFSVFDKETDCLSFVKKFLQAIYIQPSKINLHIFSFSKKHIRLLYFAKSFAYLKWYDQGIIKNIYFIIFWIFYFFTF